jgi:hypothetical protein
MPPWVIDYVLVHELAHLLVPRHGLDFWALVDRYPRTERARGYLQGVAAAAGLRVQDEDDLGLHPDPAAPADSIPPADAAREPADVDGPSSAGAP